VNKVGPGTWLGVAILLDTQFRTSHLRILHFSRIVSHPRNQQERGRLLNITLDENLILYRTYQSILSLLLDLFA